jgi:DNA polymerase
MALYQADPEKADLYKDFASRLYDVPVDEVTKAQRQVGKVAHLGLGFGAGAATFQKVAKLMGGVDMDLDEAREVVETWRSAYSEIVRGWRTCHEALPAIMRGATGRPVDPWGMIVPVPEGLKTPKGMIRYPDLRTERNDDNRVEFVYAHGRNKARIYAGKIDENIVQHLARCVIADNALIVQRRTGLTPALMVHDELVYVVPEDEAETVLETVQQTMRTPPDWWPELVTWSEGDIADTYGDAK